VTPEILLQLTGLLFSSLIAVLAWSMRRNIQSLESQIKDVATDVRQLAAQGARHGESLAAGVQQFKNMERRLDKLEERQDEFQALCIACRTERAR
jgi:septal ring factor EnvC (AmiA/AmiB activator)